MKAIPEDANIKELANQVEIDARPALPATEHSLWQLAEKKRDNIAAIINEEFNKEKITAWIRKSKSGEYPIFLVVNYWRQMSETDLMATFDRSFLKITISVAPYLENHLTYKVELKRHRRKFIYDYWVLSSGEVAELARYLIRGGDKPQFFKPRVSAIRRFLGAFIPFVGKSPKNKLIAEARPKFRTWPTILGWGGTLFIITGFFVAEFNYVSSYGIDNIIYLSFFVIAGITAITAAIIISRRRPYLDAVPKQSVRTPRREFLVDSWHVSVPGAGKEFERFRDRLYDAVIGNDPAVKSNIELHQNQTPTGFEERERLVLSKGQATLHLHVYPYSNDAFVGWESYLNWNRWAEGDTVSTTVHSDGTRVTYRSLDVDLHIPTDFDLIDLNVLAETAHGMLVNEVKAFLKEQEIEADLDFKIIRGDRVQALKEGKTDNNKSHKGKFFKHGGF